MIDEEQQSPVQMFHKGLQQARRQARFTAYDYAIGIILLSLAGMVVVMIYEVMK